MKYDPRTDFVTLECSGRILYANAGIIGIGPDLKPADGYDGGLALVDCGWDAEMTPPERAELADAMIARWQAFKDAR